MVEFKLIDDVPAEHEDCQAKRIFSYSVINRKGKEIPKIRACSNVSIHTESDIPKPIFGDPHRRCCYEYRLNDAFRENQRIVVRKWSVIKSKETGKYIIDPYFARRVYGLYRRIYLNTRNKIERRKATGKEVINWLIKIKEAVRERRKEILDSTGTPVVSVNYINRLIELLVSEFDLEREIILPKNKWRLQLDIIREVEPNE